MTHQERNPEAESARISPHDVRDAQWRVSDRILGAISLMRPVNAAISFAAILAAGYIASGGALSWTRQCAGALAGMLLGSAANVFNDIVDVRIDRINRPRRALPSGRVSPRGAWQICVGVSVVGCGISVLLGPICLALAVIAMILMTAYSTTLKRIPLVGNAAVGVLTGLAMLYGAAAAGAVTAGIVPALFAFLANGAREVVKDMQDIAGDTAEGVRTFPARYGMRAARILVTACMALLLLASPVPWLLGLFGQHYLIFSLAGVDSLLIFLTFAWWWLPEYRAIPTVSAGLKAVMIMGIIAFALGTSRVS